MLVLDGHFSILDNESAYIKKTEGTVKYKTHPIKYSGSQNISIIVVIEYKI